MSAEAWAEVAAELGGCLTFVAGVAFVWSMGALLELDRRTRARRRAERP